MKRKLLMKRKWTTEEISELERFLEKPVEVNDFDGTRDSEGVLIGVLEDEREVTVISLESPIVGQERVVTAHTFRAPSYSIRDGHLTLRMGKNDVIITVYIRYDRETLEEYSKLLQKYHLME